MQLVEAFFNVNGEYYYVATHLNESPDTQGFQLKSNRKLEKSIISARLDAQGFESESNEKWINPLFLLGRDFPELNHKNFYLKKNHCIKF